MLRPPPGGPIAAQNSTSTTDLQLLSDLHSTAGTKDEFLRLCQEDDTCPLSLYNLLAGLTGTHKKHSVHRPSIYSKDIEFTLRMHTTYRVRQHIKDKGNRRSSDSQGFSRGRKLNSKPWKKAGRPVIPALVVHPLTQQLHWRLSAVRLQRRHVQVIDKDDAFLPKWRPIYSLHKSMLCS